MTLLSRLPLLLLWCLQVLATSPFNVLGILCMTYVLYGMAGMRPGWEPILKAGIVAGVMYLTALQVGG
jgi:branched-subunit amino acid transport protein